MTKAASFTHAGLTFLGPATEARILAAFECGCVITKAATAKLLGLDEKTVGALTERGVIQAVPRGQGALGYTEDAVRTYLMRPAPTREKTPCPSTNQRKARTGTTTSSSKVVAFTARPASLRTGKPKR